MLIAWLILVFYPHFFFLRISYSFLVRTNPHWAITMVATPDSDSCAIIGSLVQFPHYECEPHIGTHFNDPSTQLSDFLKAPNSDELIKDLATLVSHRGVVFFSAQDLMIEEQLVLGNRLGELSGKPKTSTLHRHPISEETPELGADVSVISSMG